MVLVSQEYINNLRRALDAERSRAQELEEDVRRLREELALLKVRKGYRAPPLLEPQYVFSSSAYNLFSRARAVRSRRKRQR